MNVRSRIRDAAVKMRYCKTFHTS